MIRLSVDAFTNPLRRRRTVIWLGTITCAFIAIMSLALGATSTYWFCANGCHKVQDDTITAYRMSSHSRVSCMACHMPVGADPVTFVVHKAEALGELYLTVTGTFELPLNEHSEVALEMESPQCTQCHGPNRVFTVGPGIIIDHAVHAEHDVPCAICHNRVAHRESFELVLEGNEKHDDFMSMTACFRCHTSSEQGPPGACGACHPQGFELKPDNHTQPGFFDRGGDSSGHASLAIETGRSIATTAGGQAVSASVYSAGSNTRLARVGEIDYCGTCHVATFCTGCHGIQMPHPADFTDGHGKAGKTTPTVCANCHAKDAGSSGGSAEFCNGCHHEASDSRRSWISQHFEVVQDTGAKACFDCHESTYCAACHVRGLADGG
ncbi:MAG: hypothetical protein CVT60_07135 [Actinobacteria bacterium HGW-Actinobacteria-10]|jgi:hypothetical protein|nr:MAG: hypothetical protein CVT60_07135 [Actinobacteria bacterium HGW-Actinobacteria-10]